MTTPATRVNILLIIPARGGSKGIPRKNLRSLKGQPLISYSIRTALASKFKPTVCVSSDDDEILIVSKYLGAKTLKRDPELSKDHVTLDPVVFDAVLKFEEVANKTYDLVVTLQPTSPLLKVESLDRAIEELLHSENIDTIISSVAKRGLSWKKTGGEFIPNYRERLNRQSLPDQYFETGSFLITNRKSITPNSRIGKKVSLAVLDEEEGVDIDTYSEFNFCEYILRRKKILFVTMGYHEIGLGHIHNCLILANELTTHEITFLVDEKSNLGRDKIKESHYPVIAASDKEIYNILRQIEPDIVVIDRLDTERKYISGIKSLGMKVVCFEDLGEGAQEADLVFNAIYPENKTYPGHYYGPSYFCARSEFILAPIVEIKKEVTRVLISFGGTDPNNLTLKTLNAIYGYCLKRKIEITVINGFGYKDYDSLARFKKIRIFKKVNNISSFMAQADICICSAGRTTYELAILGVPTIVLAQNQRELTHFFCYEKNGFSNLGMGTQVKEDSILKSFRLLAENASLRKEKHQKMLVQDIRSGVKRVIQHIKELIEK